MRTSETAIQREVGRRIQAARARADLSQAEVARASGIDFRRYQRLEQGRVNPTIRTLLRVANALEVDIWALLSKEHPQ